MKCSEIRQRYDGLRSQRRTIEETYQQIEKWVCPQRGEFYEDMKSEHEQRTRRPEIYDYAFVLMYSMKTRKLQNG